MRKIFITIICAFLSLLCYSQNVIFIWQKDGEMVQFVFDSQAEMTYSGSDLIITSDEKQAIFQLSTLKKATFQIGKTDVDDVHQPQIVFYIKNDKIIVENGPANASLFLYAINGSCVGTWKTDKQGYVEVDLNGVKEHILIVSLENITYKIVKP